MKRDRAGRRVATRRSQPRRQRRRPAVIVWLVLAAIALGACAPAAEPDALASAAQQRMTTVPAPSTEGVPPSGTEPAPAAATAVDASPAAAPGTTDRVTGAATSTAADWTSVPSDAAATTLRERPADAPDVAIIAFSGHCGLWCATQDTWAYLDQPTSQTGGVAVLDVIRAAYLSQGLSVQVFSASSFVTSHRSAISGKIEAGYLQAQAYLDHVKRDWIDGVENPTRVVIVAHSHGTVWASLLTMNNLDVTFDTMVSIDAICWQWWAKHKGYIRETFVDGPWPIPFPLDQGDPCGTLTIPGQDRRFDINDVISANVIYGIEVRTAPRILSFDPNLIADDQPNVRINGTGDNLWGIQATEGHSGVARHYNRSIAWVASLIEGLGLPDHSRYSMSTFVLPAPPDGYAYQRGLVEPTSP